MRKKAYKPMSFNELVDTFAEQQDDRDQFQYVLDKLEEGGHIVRTRAQRYGVPERLNLVRGTLQGNAKGFGFVLPDHPDFSDVFIHANDLNGAMDGDTVLARLHGKGKQGRRAEGEVVRIIKRGRQEVVGTFHQASQYFGFVVPDDKRLAADIFIPHEAQAGATDRQKVVVQIKIYPQGRKNAEGVIKEIIGHKDDPGVDILSIVRKHQLPESFPEEVLQAAEQVPDSISEAEVAERRDLRDRQMVTIDGADAKDLDDAVSIEQLEHGHVRLGVHIADVSYYVREDSALDEEAMRRGCSVYLVDRVIPMLPPRLSNGICSLNPQVDRLTMTCDMEIDSSGDVVDYDIYPSVIRTTERMTYADVKSILVDGDPALIERYAQLIDDFRRMEELSLTLRSKRMRRGAIDFDFTEAKILVDEDGKPTDIVPRPRTVAERMIEEFMLIANETVAEHFFRQETPFVYRIHEKPNSEKLQSFAEFITHFGYQLRGQTDDIKPRALQDVLEEIAHTPEEAVISKVMLRSMQQAKYSPESLGHFGLAAKFYSHFTSPIRRYPDLIIHRIIRESVTGQLTPERKTHYQQILGDISEQSSRRERMAIDAERETNDLKKAEFMVDKVGEEFDGVISSVTSFGLFVELENTIEGLVHVSYMTDDYYHYNERTYTLNGELSGKAYHMGDAVRVKVMGVDLEERKINFELLESGEGSTTRRPTKQPQKKSANKRAGHGKRKPKTKVKAKSGSPVKGKSSEGSPKAKKKKKSYRNKAKKNRMAK
ncbi:ribonuclease R [Mechercharimyces sp. CAU 1602]|uniref:ribonuclease R n=1 Tax=Mechercharimyces sp. CAU 1602 TaxID=2973933 RepID=UPI0037CAF3B7